MTTTLIIGGNSGIGQRITTDMFHNAERNDWIYTPHIEHLDVTMDDSIHLWFKDHEPMDEVVYCAGMQRLEKVGELTTDALDVIDVNYIGFIRVINALAYNQPDHKTSVVAVVSDASRVAMRSSIAYCSSKAALAHAVRCAAREMAPRWRVNGVSPAVVADTPMTDYIDDVVPRLRGWSDNQAREYEKSMIPMGRRASKGEVSDAVQYVLRGPEFMTGSILDVTGGK